MSQEKELIKNDLVNIKESVDLFYQQKTGEALQQFGTVLDTVVAMVDTLFHYKESHDEFSMDEERVKSVLTEALAALEDNDMILLADIIQYDFVEYIEDLVQSID